MVSSEEQKIYELLSICLFNHDARSLSQILKEHHVHPEYLSCYTHKVGSFVISSECMDWKRHKHHQTHWIGRHL